MPSPDRATSGNLPRDTASTGPRWASPRRATGPPSTTPRAPHSGVSSLDLRALAPHVRFGQVKGTCRRVSSADNPNLWRFAVSRQIGLWMLHNGQMDTHLAELS